MTDTAITFAGVEKGYGRQKILSDISLVVDRGEFVALVGVNGAGKSTLLKCLLDFASLDAGAIEIFGRPHTRTDSRAGIILPAGEIHPAVLPDRPGFYSLYVPAA